MRRRRSIWILLCLLCVAGAWLLWRHERGQKSSPSHPPQAVAPAARPSQTTPPVANHGVISTNPARISLQEWNTNRFAGRLSNTTNTIGQLVGDPHAILLENALIDTRLPLNFVFPKNLQPEGDPGAYIVQAKGPINRPFRAMLTDLGATIVSYIPNDAYLVRVSASVANALQANSLVQAVVPYEPYYKIGPSLLYPAVHQIQLADGEALVLGLYANGAKSALEEIPKLGGQIIGKDQSPFGPVVRVIPPQNWTILATLRDVGWVEPFHPRAAANDLVRATLGVAADSLTATNYLGLTGSNIIVAVDDTGIDAQHDDLKTGTAASTLYGKVLGVISDSPANLVDTNGHGTHVAGIIAGDGEESMTVTNAPGSTLPGGTGTNYQFRGMAPGATLYALNLYAPDQYLQEAAALTNALISNNSWVYSNDFSYDLAAASYDAAVRDALPTVTGSQPVLFVFAAGNDGDGVDNSDQGGGIADSIESPATAKNVITVGALQEQRNITATVTNADGTSDTPWADETSTSSRVAGFSSRGNVGIGIEGKYGRYKPDVCAPGTFIISDRSEQWDINSYFYQNPTNDQMATFSGINLQPGATFTRPFPFVPTNAVQLTITTYTNVFSPSSYASLPTLMGLVGSPGFQYLSANNPVVIPGDPNAPTLSQIFNSERPLAGFNYAISNNIQNEVIFDLKTDILTTNGSGNYFLVLSNLDNSIGSGPPYYYRYESGTSMAAADVSGVLALMQEFYANAFHSTPSPAMLKAMLINGARSTSSYYNYNVQNSINYEGWGLANLPDSLPLGITNQLDVPCSAFIQDQSSTNALATGDSQTYFVTTTNPLSLRVTLAWTDPPGDPAAAIKLVNNLELVVTNLSNPTNPIVYYGNDFDHATGYLSSKPEQTNTPPVFDSINNVENVYLPRDTGTNFSVTVMGYRVNVNAVTAQTNNIVQDYALVMSTGVTNSMTVTTIPFVSNPTGDQQTTYLSPTTLSNATSTTSYQLLLNQFVGASSPLLGTNTVAFSTNAPQGFGPNNWQVTVGQTNQWHFYVATNANSLSNAAFVIFNPNAPDPDTLSVPRMGVFGGSVGNATREADIDLYVSTDPTLTNLNPVAISNAVVLGQVGGPPGDNFAGASLGRGSTEFVADTNAWSRSPKVYYIGVKSEDQMAAEYGFIAIFTSQPFSSMSNGVQTVYGVPVPMNIPDGSPKNPGRGYVFGLALYPETAGTVTLSNLFYHQNFGDLVGTLTLNGGHADVLNNHDSFPNPTVPDPYPYNLIYDDSAGGGIPGSRPSDGPGSLVGFMGQSALGVWQLTEVDDSLTQTGFVSSSTITIQPHQNLNTGAAFTNLPPNSWFYGYIDVPPGATSLTAFATNIVPNAISPLGLFVKRGSEPTTNDFDAMTLCTNSNARGQWGALTIGPPLESGRYFVGVYNPPGNQPESGILYAFYTLGIPPGQAIFNSTDTPKAILDDAVTYDSIYVPANQYIYSLDVGLAVQHPRISDLVFHLISPDGTRVLLMENRGGTDPNGAGNIASVTTNVPVPGNFDLVAATNYANGTIAGWNVTGGQVTVQTDPANTPLGSGLSNYLALANGTLSANLPTTPGATYTLTFQYRGPGIVSMWRGESNALDSVDGNNGSWSGTEAYSTGEVDSAFDLNGSSYVQVPNASSLNPSGSFSIEGWIYPQVDQNGKILSKWGDEGSYSGNRSYALQVGTGLGVAFQICDFANQNNFAFQNFNVANVLQLHKWNFVAGTYDSATGIRHLYVNGFQYAHTNSPVSVYASSVPVTIGTWLRAPGVTQDYFDGLIDELGFYGRCLSPSEVQAIYAASTNGDFNPGQSLPTSLAEAQLTINNNGRFTNTTFFGSNTTWRTMTVSFTAASTETTLQLQGLEPGMLLDAASVTNITTNYNYLVFTENTNLTTTPIKFAIPPFTSGVNLPVWQNGFEQGSVGTQTTPMAGTYFAGGWLVDTGSVDVLGTGFQGAQAPPQGNYFLDLDGNGPGEISTNIPTVVGQTYTLGFAYTKNASASTPPHAQVWVNGAPLGTITANIANSWANLNWQTNLSFVFTATSLSTHLVFQSLDPSYEASGVLLDDITLTPNNVYYLPEESLDMYDGLNAQGLWTLEIQDDRAGATNPPPSLLSWQLRFTFITGSTGITPGVTTTNVIPAHSWAYYKITVPSNADMATNTLVFATGPLFMWFNSTNDPIGSTPPDSLLLGNSIGGSSTLSTFSTPTNIVPGGVYYIGLQNTNNYQVTNGFQVNFHYIEPPTSLTNGVPVTNSVPAGGMSYFAVDVPTNALYATNLLLFANLPVNVWFNQTNLPVGLTNSDYLLITNAVSGTNVLGATNVLGTNAIPPLLPGLTYYLAVQNTNTANVNFGLEVNFMLASILTNGVPSTNSVPSNSFAYFEVQVPTNADYATNILLFANLPVNVWFNQNGPPVGTNPPDYLLIGDTTNGTNVLAYNTTPPLVPGATYFLAVQNTNAATVTFGLEVDFHLKPPQVITGPTITQTNINGTNGFLVQWSGPTNYQYTIQWTTNLAPPALWNTVANPVINVTYLGTNGNYSWFDDGSQTGGFPPQKFYRVLANLLAQPITNSTPVAGVIVPGTVTPLAVSVPANAIAASNLLISASGPINVYYNPTTPFTGGTNAGDVLMLSNVTSGNFLLTGSSTPPLVPGANYYLGLQNPGTNEVSFVFQVNFGYGVSSSNPPAISTITFTNNGILLTWFAQTNYRFQVQWTTNLAASAWTTIPGVVLTNLASFTPTNGIGEFQYFDDGSQTGGFGQAKFYRLIAYPPGATIPSALSISSVLMSPGGLQIQWSGSTNYTYQVAWTTNLALPISSWTVLSNLASPTLTYSSGMFTFTDASTNTGGAAEAKFFRVLLLP